jgi:hypothetical protein
MQWWLCNWKLLFQSQFIVVSIHYSSSLAGCFGRRGTLEPSIGWWDDGGAIVQQIEDECNNGCLVGYKHLMLLMSLLSTTVSWRPITNWSLCNHKHVRDVYHHIW